MITNEHSFTALFIHVRSEILQNKTGLEFGVRAWNVMPLCDHHSMKCVLKQGSFGSGNGDKEMTILTFLLFNSIAVQPYNYWGV